MTELDEARLIEKLRAIEALHARPGSEGERAAAGNARQRILERLRELADADPPVEYRFSMADMWSRRVFLALLRRYEIRPYRYRGQRHTTVMAKVSKGFVDETLWPEFQALSSTLRSYLDEVTGRVVAEVIHADVSEATEVEEPKQLTFDEQPDRTTGARASSTTPRDEEAASGSPRQASSRRRKKKYRQNKRKRR